jgi:hypothetical protein
MLGLPENRYADPAAWAGLEAELGLALPSDYKTIVDGYAPVTVNVHLSLMHPATTWWNLSKKIRDTSEAWARTSWQRDWAEDSPSDPRVICGVQELAFGTRHGLIPWLLPAPRVTLVRSLTVEKVDSMGLVVRRWIQCSAGKS